MQERTIAGKDNKEQRELLDNVKLRVKGLFNGQVE